MVNSHKPLTKDHEGFGMGVNYNHAPKAFLNEDLKNTVIQLHKILNGYLGSVQNADAKTAYQLSIRELELAFPVIFEDEVVEDE